MKNSVYIFFTIAHCIGGSLHAIQKKAPIKINAEILEFADKNMPHIIDVNSLELFRNTVFRLLTHKLPYKTAQKAAQECTFEDLAKHENDVSPKERKLILTKFIGQFVNITQRKEFQGFYKIHKLVSEVIECWKTQRNCSQSLIYLVGRA